MQDPFKRSSPDSCLHSSNQPRPWPVQEAVYAARESAGHTGFFQLDSPATPERLRMACADHLTAPFAPADLRCKISC